MNFAQMNQGVSPRTKTLLPESFTPSAYSVIIGKGKMPAQATGNRRLRVLVDLQVENYGNAQFKRDKTFIVSSILDTIHATCPVGSFVKFDGERWWEVRDSVSREKIACMFRDSLSGKYKSSNKNKVERRRQKKALLRSKNSLLSSKLQTIPKALPQVVKSQPESAPPITIASSIFDGLDLVDMFESVDESIFDMPTLPEKLTPVISDEEASF